MDILNGSIAGSPKNGDIVVFVYPPDPRKDFVKRAIGLPGDSIEIRDKVLFINEIVFNENYVIYSDDNILPAGMHPRDNFGPITVPKNALFVLGDNRDASFDSRFWGFVDLGNVKGRVTTIYWSWDAGNSRVRWDRIGKAVN